jgi:hypothetical protein
VLDVVGPKGRSKAQSDGILLSLQQILGMSRRVGCDWEHTEAVPACIARYGVLPYAEKKKFLSA